MTEFINLLTKRLRQPLPGSNAQAEMSARSMIAGGFKFEHQGPPKHGGVIILLYPKEDKWYLPLMKRPTYEGIHSGQISLPGGKREHSDKDLIDTALRETAEEIGVKIERGQVIGALSPLYIVASHYNVLPVVAVTNQLPKFHPDSREVETLIEADLTILLDPARRKEKEIEVRNTKIHAPYFDVESEIVWGATAMILNEFLTITREVGRR